MTYKACGLGYWYLETDALHYCHEGLSTARRGTLENSSVSISPLKDLRNIKSNPKPNSDLKPIVTLTVNIALTLTITPVYLTITITLTLNLTITLTFAKNLTLLHNTSFDSKCSLTITLTVNLTQTETLTIYLLLL